MGRKALSPDGQPSDIVLLRLPPELHKIVKEVASVDDKNKSAFMRDCILAVLEIRGLL